MGHFALVVDPVGTLAGRQDDLGVHPGAGLVDVAVWTRSVVRLGHMKGLP